MADPGTTMATPTFSLREDELITLFVGPEEHKLVVHESCITRNSDFFKAAMKKEWTEGQTRSIQLPEETCVETFVYYLNFAYHGKLPTEEIVTKAKTGFIDKPFDVLGNIYVLGERMLDRVIQNAVISEILRLVKIKSKDSGVCHNPGPRMITTVYDGTSVGSPLRRLLIDLYVTKGSGTWDCSKHSEFLTDLWKALMEKTLAQKAVLDFRGNKLAAEDYLQ